MEQTPRKWLLLLSPVLLLVVPAITSHLVYAGWPPGFGVFPPQQSPNVPGFDPVAFLIASAIGGTIAAFLLFPRWFGFKPGGPAPPASAHDANGGRRLPAWFWPGVAIWLLSWAIMWGQFSWAGALVHYTFVPLWWGYIVALDGLVYYRTAGRSLLATRPLLMLAIAVSSCFGWYLFEYLDYFVLSNWYYPYDQILSRTGYFIWFALAYTTVLPSIFEWYNLLNTFGGLRSRWRNGPQLALATRGWWTVLWIGVLFLVAIVIWPFYSFALLWIAPLFILTAALMLSRCWTPAVPLCRGDWSMVVLMGLGCLINYVFGEMWNFWSPPNNPNFWKYDVPFVNVLPIFEMPLLGFFGYLPFGIVCWLWWLQCCYLLGLSPNIDVSSVETAGLERSTEPRLVSGLALDQDLS